LRLTAPRKPFLAVLTDCNQVANGKVKPILGNVYLVAEENTLHASATDLEIGISSTLSGVAVSKPGKCLLPVKRLCDILRESPNEDFVSIEVGEKTTFVTLGMSEFELATENADDFPCPPTWTEGPHVILDALATKEALKFTSFAAADEDGKFKVACVLWEQRDDYKSIEIVATDTKRLSHTVVPTKNVIGGSWWRGKVSNSQCTATTKSVRLLERKLSSCAEGDELAVQFSPQDVLFRVGETTIYSRLVEGRYPPWREIVPKKAAIKYEIPFNAGPFLKAVKQAAIMADAEMCRVSLAFTKNSVLITSRGGTSGSSKVPFAIDNSNDAPVNVNFDPAYLIEFLRVVPDDQSVVLHMVSGDRPALFKCGSSVQYVVMPIV
jgi:DNA polymerase-3 subunit beta